MITRETDLGTEKFCPPCNEWWPADSEFFYVSKNEPGGWQHHCKACEMDRRRAYLARVRAAGAIAPRGAA